MKPTNMLGLVVRTVFSAL